MTVFTNYLVINSTRNAGFHGRQPASPGENSLTRGIPTPFNPVLLPVEQEIDVA